MKSAHSCLIPVTEMRMKVLYVFVDILVDINHLVETIVYNFPVATPLWFLGTIQFNASIFKAKEMLECKGLKIIVPQEKPRCAGEVNLG